MVQVLMRVSTHDFYMHVLQVCPTLCQNVSAAHAPVVSLVFRNVSRVDDGGLRESGDIYQEAMKSMDSARCYNMIFECF